MCYIYSMMFFLLSIFMFILSLIFLMNDMVNLIEIWGLTLNSTNFVYIILLDWMSLLFMSVVMFISSMVIFYSEEYMSGDLTKNRFILMVVMFVFSMMLMILSPNLISILLGWDGLGLVSYCLVIYYQNVKSYNAGMLTALSNRIGDVAFLMAIAWMMNFGSWSFIYYLDFLLSNHIMMFISGLMILAAMTKSAQMPFSSWLPAAMAAPTPVSSLVHSSTLVTAGVYLLIRFSNCLNLTHLYFLVFISSLTMFMSGLGANFEYDLKKIIALSTLSQLGLMLSILALGEAKLAFFHLITHALFKALLFMCAGNIIHSLGNCQDIRFMGGLIKHLPLTCIYMNICNWALCGIPFMSGFYSKDLIVEVMSMSVLNLYIYVIFYISIGFTVAYSFRLTYYSLIGSFNFLSFNMMKESSFVMIKGMSGLILLVVFMGSCFNWMLYSTPVFIILPFYMKIMTLLMVLMGMIWGQEFSKFKLGYKMNLFQSLTLMSFLGLMWNMPLISTLGLNLNILKSGKIYAKTFDQGWIEYYGSKSLFSLLKKIMNFQIISMNHLKIFMMLMFIWFMFLLVLI
uniref:NADH-ubiquinone oxidoreductase chain 5 n=1 Tax=Syphrea sp. REN-2018 TaxID=2506510 RepID=A0A411D9Z9_9CUCU|nr:NADH dehydrogenase subunit 5 [Syphrea sp. REN-2018]